MCKMAAAGQASDWSKQRIPGSDWPVLMAGQAAHAPWALVSCIGTIISFTRLRVPLLPA